MGMSALPEMYAGGPRAAGLRVKGTHIRQSTVPMLHKLILLIYSRMHIVIVGFYYDVSIMFCAL